MSLIAEYSQQLASLLPVVKTVAFPPRLIEMIKALVPVSDATIIVYPNTDLPLIDYFEPGEDGSTRLDLFRKGAFLLDPYYQAAAQERKFGFFRLQELAPEGFQEGEYYRTWYRDSGWQDECGYLLASGQEGFVNISLGRTLGGSPFNEEQLDLLADLSPLLEVLCLNHWGSGEPAASSPNLRAQLQMALDGFGSSQLTDREAQVINLVLRGHSTRNVAEKLSISMETVKLHRKHAYARLEIGSQTELFYLFLDSLMSARDFAGGDTLEAYLQPSKK